MNYDVVEVLADEPNYILYFDNQSPNALWWFNNLHLSLTCGLIFYHVNQGKHPRSNSHCIHVTDTWLVEIDNSVRNYENIT